MPRIFEGYCLSCGRLYKGRGTKFCSKGCADASRYAAPSESVSQFPTPITLNVPHYTPGPTTTDGDVSVHYGDIHFPFHDQRALNILYDVISDVSPTITVDHGDTLDCHAISRFEKNPHDRVDYQIELELAAAHHGTIHSLTPEARHIWLLGNHEDRLRRLVWDICSKREVESLFKLPAVMEAIKWENLTGVGALGWEIIPYPDHIILWNRLLLTHGSTVRKWSGYSAKAEHERYGKSGISGHTHRRGVFEHRDYNGNHAWWELGLLGHIESRYVVYPDWQQGFAVVSWSPDHTTFGVEEVRIHDGQAHFRGRSYTG